MSTLEIFNDSALYKCSLNNNNNNNNVLFARHMWLVLSIRPSIIYYAEAAHKIIIKAHKAKDTMK